MWRKIKIHKSPMSGWGFFEVARAILGPTTVHYDNVYFIPIKLRSNNSIYWIIYCPNVKKKRLKQKTTFQRKRALKYSSTRLFKLSSLLNLFLFKRYVVLARLTIKKLRRVFFLKKVILKNLIETFFES